MPLSETVLIVMLLLAIGMISASVCKKWPIPYTVLLVCIGVVLSEVSANWVPLAPLAHFRLTPELVLFVFLPTLIFESGLNLNARQLIKDIAPVLALAVPALLFSTGVVGVGMWMVLPIDLPLALVFGALISATDPVAVVALFKALGTPERLTVLVEGESLLNDATAIVVFNILLGIVLHGSFTWGDAGFAVGEFLKVFLGGIFTGVIMGLFISWLMTRLHGETSATLILSLVLAYCSFIVAEHGLHLSGVMAVVAASVTLGMFGVPRLSRETVNALHEIWEFLVLACNTLLFIMIGMAVNLSNLVSNLPYILLAVGLIMAARASMIYTLIPSATRVFKLPKITLGERHIMWWGGLKGGLAIAIVLSIPESLPGRDLLLDLTVGVVLFTLLINAPTIQPLIHALGIDRLTDDERIELKHSLDTAKISMKASLQGFHHSGLLSKANCQQISQQLTPLLEQAPIEMSDAQTLRRLQLNQLRIERAALDDLYKMGVLPTYSFLDLCGELTRARDHIQNPHRRIKAANAKRRQNPFLRVEDGLIAWLREKNWAFHLLSKYQNHRLAQHLIKDIAHILMCEAVLTTLKTETELLSAHQTQITQHYESRLTHFREGIAQLRTDFPIFYQSFETRLSTQAILEKVLLATEQQAHEGMISAKPKMQIERCIQQAIKQLPPLSKPVMQLQPKELIAMIPLFNGLNEAALERLATTTQLVSFLANDIIIGEGEHGDSLYIISRGRVLVSHQNTAGEAIKIAELDAGEFFGETALFGESVRGATVTALHACKLLRLTRKEVLIIADQHSEVADRLTTAKQARTT